MEWVAKKSRRAANAVEFENSLGFSAMTFISKGDMDRVVSGVPKYLMPLFFPINGVPYERKPGDRFNVLWMGGFGWYPNAQGVIWFAKEVYPRISDNLHASNITFHFCGSHPPDELRALHDGIDFHVHGFVNDIQAMLDDAHLLIVPLCSGGGIRVKIIEAMSSGIPVLSTHKGCEGIGVEDGRNIIVRDDPAEFAEEIVLASRDPRKMYELSIAGLQFMSDQYSREATLDAKRKAYEQVGVF